jgi:exodeoxyribonuclease VII small subunit
MAEKTQGVSDGLGDMSIEAALGRLEEIAAILENSQTGLKESLDVYSEGVQLINRCKNYLCDVEKEMIMLTGQEET